MGYTTIRGVPLLKTGTWNASVGGTQPISAGDLQAMAEAARDDSLDLAVVKIGHVDRRFPVLGEDGEPAYGQVENVRLSDDGQTLLGDFVNVPTELAEKIDSAYPYRSAEFRSNVSMKDAAGKIVKSFKKVLTAVALLGATPPAVKGLGNIHAALSEGHELDAESGQLVAFKLGDPLTAEQTRSALLQATPGAGEVLDFTDKLYWYSQIDGDPLTGTLRYFQNDYTETAGVVDVGQSPVEVQEDSVRQFVPKPGTSTTPQTPAGDTAPVPPPAIAAAQTPLDNLANKEGGADMATLADLFTAVEVPVPDDGTDYTTIEMPDAAVEAISKAFTDLKNGNVDSDGKPNAGGAPATPGATTGLSEGSVVVSEARLSDLTSQNESLTSKVNELMGERDAKRRDDVIAVALSEGRLHPSEQQSWREALDTAEETTTTLLSQRTPIVPVDEIGSAVAPAVAQLAEAQEQALIEAENNIWKGRN